MNLQEIPTSILIAWDARIERDLEVFVPTFIPQDGETAQTWCRDRLDIRAEIERRGDGAAVRQLDDQKYRQRVPDRPPSVRSRVLAWFSL